MQVLGHSKAMLVLLSYTACFKRVRTGMCLSEVVRMGPSAGAGAQQGDAGAAVLYSMAQEGECRHVFEQSREGEIMRRCWGTARRC